MARITHVKKAQPRYEQKPVIDPATGEQKQTPVMRNGVQRQNKHGRPTFMKVTENDLTKPLPLHTCGACGKPIEVGTPYKHISPKSGPYGGATLRRHEACPTWQVWDYSSSLSARTAQISHQGWESLDSALDGATDISDIESVLSEIADEIRSLSEEKAEGASNIEDGFGHPTSQSEELQSIADELESWADDVENADVPEVPEPEEADCEQCEGTGKHEARFWVMNADGSGNVFPDQADGFDSEDEAQEALDALIAQTKDAPADFTIEEREEDCTECDGIGTVTPDEPTDEQMDDWRTEVRDALGIIDECPV